MTVARITPGDGDARHGTQNGYGNLGCRCDACREANTDYMRARGCGTYKRDTCPSCGGKKVARAERCAPCFRAEVEAPHGSEGRYARGCRCGDCRAAAVAGRRHRRQVVIYALVDPLGTPRYVGQTRKKLSSRLCHHVSSSAKGSRPLDAWLRSCPGASIVPLEAVATGEADAAERRWIRQMREGCVPLLNIADGGKSGLAGWKQTPEVRARIAAARKGKPLSAEHRAKLSAAHSGVPLSADHRSAISRGSVGLLPSPETRAKISASKSGVLNPMSAANRAARVEARDG